jgi:hypothetical protein
MELEEWEHVTCLKNVSLAYEGTRSGLKGYIAVGTNYNYGEDITSRGRVRTSDTDSEPWTESGPKLLHTSVHAHTECSLFL